MPRRALTCEDILKALPPEIISKLSFLADVFKVIGIAFLIYLIFLIFRSISEIIKNRKIKKIYNKVNEIDEKLDILLKDKKKGSKKDKK